MSTYDVLAGLYRELGISQRDVGGKVVIEGQDPASPSTHRIGDATAAALAALGTEAALLWRERGGVEQDVIVSVASAVHQLIAALSTTVNGVPTEALYEDREVIANIGFYRAADGRHIFLQMGYPGLRNIASEVLGCPLNCRERIVGAIARWDAFALEEAISSRGGTAVAVRTHEEWRNHPQAKHLLDSPLIRIEQIGASTPEPFPELDPSEDGALPLSGLRVLDNSHVLAAPLASRIMAEFGADVLHISSPLHPDPNAMIIDTGIGKRAAFCDLNDSYQARRFWAVLRDTDVYVCNYLNLDAKGFDPLALAENRPGIIVLDYRCFGVQGPWSMRGGFDQIACSATGFCVEEGSFEEPKIAPTGIISDYLAAVLGTAGVIEALRRRSREGGSYRVHFDLAKACMWVQDLGLFSREEAAAAPAIDHCAVNDRLTAVEGPFGTTRYLPTQIRFSTLAPRLTRGAEPLGASPLQWW